MMKMLEEVDFLLKKFLPDEHVNSVFEITAEKLKKQQIKGVITDLDNTLVEWDRPLATEKVIDWLAELEEAGIVVTIVSNNNEARVKKFCEPHNVPFIHRAFKPSTRAFETALQTMNLQKDETVVIGDQLMTDILGGNRAGFYTILVVPVTETDGMITKFNRFLERRILNSFKRKGLLMRED